MMGLRTIIGGIGATGAASAVVLTGVATQTEDGSINAGDITARDSFDVCLKTDLPFFEGIDKGCYQLSDVTEFQDRKVVDNDGDVVTYNVAHPVDHSQALKTCNTCREYREYAWSGWYAPTSREMRREAYFVRACGLLDVLSDARQATETHFAAEGLTDNSFANFVSDSLPQLTEVIAGGGASYEMTSEVAGSWQFFSETQSVLVQEIAYADFDKDGVEDALVFVTAGPVDGTARVYDYGLIKLMSDDGPLSFVHKTTSDQS